MQSHYRQMQKDIAEIYTLVYEKLIDPICTKHIKEQWKDYYKLIESGIIKHKPEQCSICRVCEIKDIHEKMIIFRDVYGINKYIEEYLDART